MINNKLFNGGNKNNLFHIRESLNTGLTNKGMSRNMLQIRCYHLLDTIGTMAMV